MNIEIAPPTSLADKAYELIRDEIILCRLSPGEVLSESIVEERYGLPRASVRNALMRLLQERLIKAVGKKTRIVAPLTIGEIQDVFLLRKTLEPMAARMAAGKVSERLLRVLDQACHEAYAPGDKAGELSFLNANRRFHLAIAEASGSYRLVQLLEQLHNEAMRMLYLGFKLQNRSDEWTHGHKHLLDALVKPDAQEAERIALELQENSFNQIMQAALSNPAIQVASLA